MAGPYWTLYDFVNANGDNEIALWLRRQPTVKKVPLWAKLDAALLRLMGQEIHTERQLIAKLDAKRDSACAELYEIRIKFKGVEYRILSYRGPSPKGQYTLLLGAKEKGDKFEPLNACQQARAKIVDIENKKGRTVEHQSTERYQQIVQAMEDKEYRDAFVEASIDNDIAFQIRANRDSRGWTQTELGSRAGIKQAVISEWEDPNYGRYTLRTLKRLASAFDIAVIVRFVPFSELADWNSRVPETDMSSPGFDNDAGLSNSVRLHNG